jgi:hypothetical protein
VPPVVLPFVFLLRRVLVPLQERLGRMFCRRPPLLLGVVLLGMLAMTSRAFLTPARRLATPCKRGLLSRARGPRMAAGDDKEEEKAPTVNTWDEEAKARMPLKVPLQAPDDEEGEVPRYQLQLQVWTEAGPDSGEIS